MAFALKAAIADTGAKVFVLRAQKTMYGGKAIAAGDTVYVFASENEGGPGLIAKGIVTAADHAGVKKPEGVARYTPRVSIEVTRAATATRPLGRAQLRPFIGKGGVRGELADRFYKQATDKIIGLSDEAAAWLDGWV
ncbi:MAG: hypothetical protein KGR48_13130 [Alphaproteobacteria bacterium]|nr:hypothetical protein [Alphaproteobacteria bacterium]